MSTEESDFSIPPHLIVVVTVTWLQQQLSMDHNAKVILARETGCDIKAINSTSMKLLDWDKQTPYQAWLKEGRKLHSEGQDIAAAFSRPKYTATIRRGVQEILPSTRVKGIHIIAAAVRDEFLQTWDEFMVRYTEWAARILSEEEFLEGKSLYEFIRAYHVEHIFKSSAMASKFPTAKEIHNRILGSKYTFIPVDSHQIEPEEWTQEWVAFLKGETEDLGELLKRIVANTKHRTRFMRDPLMIGVPCGLKHAEVTSAKSVIEDGKKLWNVECYTVEASEKRKSFKRKGGITYLSLTDEQYNALDPQETREYGKLSPATFDLFIAKVKRFSRVTQMVGDTALLEQLNGFMEKLTAYGESGDTIAKRLKSGSEESRLAVSSMAAELAQSCVDIKESLNVKGRKINVNQKNWDLTPPATDKATAKKSSRKLLV